MKKLFLSLMLLLPMMAVAEDILALPDDSLSALFSKQFVLPDKYIMNAFDCVIGDTVYFTSSITAQTNSIPMMGYMMRNKKQADMRDELADSIKSWLAHCDCAPKEGYVLLHYAPLYYALPSDTLYGDIRISNQSNAQYEEACMHYVFYVRNRKDVPYYATVKRHNTKLSMHVHDAATHLPFIIEQDNMPTQNTLFKNGVQCLMDDNGQSVRIRKTYRMDTLMSAERLNQDGQVCERYHFTVPKKSITYPTLNSKELLYPSGAVKVRVEYSDDKKISAFREDGSAAKYVPSRNVEKVVRKAFIKSFKKPKPDGRWNINYIELTTTVTGYISETGEVTINPEVEDINWTYNYNSNSINSSDVKKMMQEYYSPYVRELIKDLSKSHPVCSPAKVDKTPVSSSYNFELKYNFMP
jgi:hypothetical protein